jgi:aspartyl-tRNA(Asn)/glutamyl-tRNA(Gln) amidotransferase subunit C
MAVSERDVRHVAELARLGLEPDRIPSLVHELNDILEHMKVLDAVDASEYAALGDGRSADLPLRADGGPPLPLSRPLAGFAPEMRDGLFVVPRLETHDDGDIEETA